MRESVRPGWTGPVDREAAHSERVFREREVAALEAQAAALADLASSVRLLLPSTATEVQNAMDVMRDLARGANPGGGTGG